MQYLWAKLGLLWAAIRRHPTIVVVATALATALGGAISTDIADVVKTSFYAKVREWSGIDEFEAQRAELAKKLETAVGVGTAYIPLPNTDQYQCREMMRRWTSSNGYAPVDSGGPNMYALEIHRADFQAQIRCVGDRTADITYAVLVNSNAYGNEAQVLYERLNNEFSGYRNRGQAIFPTDQNLLSKLPYFDMRQVNVRATYGEIREAVEKNLIPKPALDFFGTTFNRSPICWAGPEGQICTYRLPRISATIQLDRQRFTANDPAAPLTDASPVTLHYLVTVVAGSFGTADYYSSQTTYAGNDVFDRIAGMPNVDKENIKQLTNSW
ncbi:MULTISPECIES: hypothetical protein [Mesorhizobium]|uniref:Uncharacterized protein n=1 Tax=Mesorhizobium denitrificans TaxID=2294114 RepID=A0A371XEU7_9HYPH|nr:MULTISPECIES: hypothetical protein [Mesorhizobium]RFC67748.1 hypothetical protein DY251_09115 [Mesorhizobium denitrificans]